MVAAAVARFVGWLSSVCPRRQDLLPTRIRISARLARARAGEAGAMGPGEPRGISKITAYLNDLT